MRAAVIREYGTADVLRIEEVDKPRIKSNQLLVKVRASTVNPIDWKIRKGMLQFIYGNKFPRILGFDIAGEVVEVGDRAAGFKPGDAIYGVASLSGGGYAEYAAVVAKFAALKPSNLSDVEAATIPGSALTALQALRDCGKLKAGQSVLVNGASGGVGSFAVQIAKMLNAEVTGVCSTRNLEWVKALGCDRVLDYTQDDFTQTTARYDLIFDAVGKRSFAECKSALKPRGIYVTTLPNGGIVIQNILTAFWPGKKAKLIFESPNRQDLDDLRKAVEAGKINPIIDRVYPLSEIAEAHRYSETERAAGKIAIAIP